MCGRYTLIRLADFTDMFPWIRPPADRSVSLSAHRSPLLATSDISSPDGRFNIAPTQPVAVVPNDGRNQVDLFRWGLIPSWAKDPAIGNKMINARVEGIASKPAFRNAFKSRRCLVPASGFYEWKKHADGRGKTPMFIRMKDRRPFAFAGLWEVWRSPADGLRVPTCTIITGPPNELMKDIHDRMPVILKSDSYLKWLDPDEKDPSDLTSLLNPYPPELMEAYVVSREVNKPANDRPELIEPALDEGVSSIPLAASRKKRPDDQPRLF